MYRNDLKLILLLSSFAFLVVQCSTLRPKNVDNGKDKDINIVEPTLRKDIVTFAKKQQGSPYKYGGMSPNKGFDCSGFTSYVMQHFDIEIPRVSRDQAKFGRRKSPKHAQIGDLLVFSRRGKVFHVGIVYANKNGQLLMVHSSSSRGVVIDNVTKSSYWRPKLAYARDVVRRD